MDHHRIISVVNFFNDDRRSPKDFITATNWGTFEAHIAVNEGTRLLGIFGSIEDATRAIFSCRHRRRA